jgi:hypothetical protein
MKITNQFREKYYPIFVEKATRIIGASLHVSKPEARDLARDFTSAFFYSHSLMKTFDSSKGDVEPFFSSWVRKTLALSYSRSEYKWRNFSALKEWMKAPAVPCSYDFYNWFNSIVKVIEGRVWASDDVEIPYSRIFKAASIQILNDELWGGQVTFKGLAKTLGVKPEQAKKAYLSLVEVLCVKRSQGLI